MNFTQLEIFVCVAELGSFARAAERLYMTPSALTQQINALERSLGCVLLERTSKGSAASLPLAQGRQNVCLLLRKSGSPVQGELSSSKAR